MQKAASDYLVHNESHIVTRKPDITLVESGRAQEWEDIIFKIVHTTIRAPYNSKPLKTLLDR